MARPTKEGLDYFSFDVDFFDNKKVRKIMRAYGPQSALILTCLLCNIYHKKGYYTLVDEDLSFDIADKIGVSEGAVKDTIAKAVQVNFFDQYQFENNKVLTSPEILARYRAGVTKRENVVIREEFTVYSGINQVNDTGNEVKDPDNTQSKVKETKVNQSKVKSIVVAAATPQVTRADFNKLIEQLDGKDTKTVWTGLKEFITNHQPNFIEPYYEAWNLYARTYGLAKVEVINDSRRKKFKSRIDETGFDFIKILDKIRGSNMLKGIDSSWKVSFDWIFENQTNYVKIIEGNYDN